MVKSEVQVSEQPAFVCLHLPGSHQYLPDYSERSYNGQAYSTLAATFLLSTSFLLFGLFYTFFLHTVKMSVLLEYEVKSKHLEQQLKDTYKDMETLQSFAFTSTLTMVHNRHYGMEQL